MRQLVTKAYEQFPKYIADQFFCSVRTHPLLLMVPYLYPSSQEDFYQSRRKFKIWCRSIWKTFLMKYRIIYDYAMHGDDFYFTSLLFESCTWRISLECATMKVSRACRRSFLFREIHYKFDLYDFQATPKFICFPRKVVPCVHACARAHVLVDVCMQILSHVCGGGGHPMQRPFSKRSNSLRSFSIPSGSANGRIFWLPFLPGYLSIIFALVKTESNFSDGEKKLISV